MSKNNLVTDVLKFAFLLIVIAAMDTAKAESPPLPDFVGEYVRLSGLEYTLPQGRYGKYGLENIAGAPEPWAATADFNGDGIGDWAGFLRNGEGGLDLVVVYSWDGDFTHQVLSSPGPDSDNLAAGVYTLPAGLVKGFPVEHPLPAPQVMTYSPNIHLVYFEKASVMYFWDGSSFADLVTSD